MTYTYKKILKTSRTIKTNVEKEYKLGVTSKWAYYIAKAIQNPNKDIKKIQFNKAPKPKGTHISRQIPQKEYLQLCRNLTNYVEKNKRLPNYLTYHEYKIRPRLYTYIFAKILIYQYKHHKQAKQVNVNSKIFKKPIETTNKVYNHFIDVFGKFDNTIDGALQKVNGKGYAYYYDDLYSNETAINRIKQGKGINCTDSCQVFYNIMEQLIALKKYKKVECLHVQCSSGGHVKLKITKNDGSTIIRDPACVLSDNGKPVTCTWCTNTGVINPKWFMENLNR